MVDLQGDMPEQGAGTPRGDSRGERPESTGLSGNILGSAGDGCPNSSESQLTARIAALLESRLNKAVRVITAHLEASIERRVREAHDGIASRIEDVTAAHVHKAHMAISDATPAPARVVNAAPRVDDDEKTAAIEKAAVEAAEKACDARIAHLASELADAHARDLAALRRREVALSEQRSADLSENDGQMAMKDKLDQALNVPDMIKTDLGNLKEKHDRLEAHVARLAEDIEHSVAAARAEASSELRGLGGSVRLALDRADQELRSLSQSSEASIATLAEVRNWVRVEFDGRDKATAWHEHLRVWVENDLEELSARLSEGKTVLTPATVAVVRAASLCGQSRAPTSGAFAGVQLRSPFSNEDLSMEKPGASGQKHKLEDDPSDIPAVRTASESRPSSTGFASMESPGGACALGERNRSVGAVAFPPPESECFVRQLVLATAQGASGRAPLGTTGEVVTNSSPEPQKYVRQGSGLSVTRRPSEDALDESGCEGLESTTTLLMGKDGHQQDSPDLTRSGGSLVGRSLLARDSSSAIEMRRDQIPPALESSRPETDAQVSSDNRAVAPSPSSTQEAPEQQDDARVQSLRAREARLEAEVERIARRLQMGSVQAHTGN